MVFGRLPDWSTFEFTAGDSSGVLFATSHGHSARFPTKPSSALGQLASPERAFLSHTVVFTKLDLVFVELVLVTGVIVAR